MSVKVDWKKGLAFVGESNAGFTLKLAGPAEDNTEDAGIRPLELLLLGLAGCTGMDVISILQKKQQNVTNFSVEVNGERAEEHPRVYKKIHIKYYITGVGIQRPAVERAVELSETKYCPAQAMLSKAAEITHEIVIVNEN